MTYRRVWEHAFVDAYRRLRFEDPATAKLVRDAVGVQWGQSRFYRLHLGSSRVLYELDGETIRIWSLGKSR